MTSDPEFESPRGRKRTREERDDEWKDKEVDLKELAESKCKYPITLYIKMIVQTGIVDIIYIYNIYIS